MLALNIARSAARSSSPCSRSSPCSAARPWPRSGSEQARAEGLLLNILPSSIADRLKVDTQTIADQFSAASILFADVVDFTPRSELLEPAEVVGLLDRLFSHFDTLAERYGLEKIKTIGDAYMVAAGVPDPRPDHARALVSMGARHGRGDALERRGRPPRAGAADRDQLGPGRGRGDRPEAVPLRPVGRRGEHREPDGVARHAGPHPDHARDLRAGRRTSSSASRAARSRSRARARWRSGTSSVDDQRGASLQ